MQEAALPILLVTFALISLQRFGRFQLNRPVAALFGALLMVLFGVVSWQGALFAVASGLEILALLLGMMMMVATLEAAGFFDHLAERMARHASSPRHFFVEVCTASAVLSALVLNDAVVLLLAPVIIKACRRLRFPPVPYLIGLTMCANVGSTATLVGNPQNAYIGIVSGMSFVRYAAIMAPVTALCLAVAVWMMLRFLDKDLQATAAAPPRSGTSELSRLDPTLIKVAAGVLGGVLVLFMLSSWLGISIAAVAMGGGTVMLFSTVAIKGFRVESILARVDWTILLLFCGLFIVLRGVEDAHLVEGFVSTVLSVGGGGGDPLTLSWLAFVSTMLSNLVSNVPAVLLLSTAASALGTEKAWLVLASSSTLAGNATLLGAAANLITAQVARSHGLEIPWLKFTWVGLPVAAATLVLSTVALAYLPI